eukprot:6209024-Pleurochrysis_carterae.AAC.1
MHVRVLAHSRARPYSHAHKRVSHAYLSVETTVAVCVRAHATPHFVKCVLLQAFHVFKIFVANPNKEPRVRDVLLRNKAGARTHARAHTHAYAHAYAHPHPNDTRTRARARIHARTFAHAHASSSRACP